MNEQESSVQMRACLCSSVTRTHSPTLAHTHALSRTFSNTPERRKPGEYAFWKRLESVVPNTKRSVWRSTRESHAIGIAPRGCMWVCTVESVRECTVDYIAKASVCLCRNECASLHACVLILAYVFISCYACAIDI